MLENNLKMISFPRILCSRTTKRKVLKALLIVILFITIKQMLFYGKVVQQYQIGVRENFTCSKSVLNASHKNLSAFPRLETLSLPRNGYAYLKDKLPESYAVKLRGKSYQFEHLQGVYPLTLYGNAYHIENVHLCDIQREIAFLIIVHTATIHFDRRQSMRDTWANKEILDKNDIRIVFLLGKTYNKSTQARIETEMTIYKDIVQGTFIDSYHNLTHKAAMSVRWVVEHCMNTKVIVKIDDDVFLPIFQFIQLARGVWSKQTKAIHCRHHFAQIHRKGKWEVDPRYFRGLKHYPFRACMGIVQVMTADMFPSLYEAAKNTSFFWIDDIYLSGMLIGRVGGVTFYYPKNKILLSEDSTLQCFNSERNVSCNLFVGSATSPGFMNKIWYRYLLLNKKLAVKYYRGK